MDSIERRLADAKLGTAIDNVTGQLPDGFTVRIDLSRGYRDVQLLRRGRRCGRVDGPLSLSQAIAYALELAENAGAD